MLAWLFSDPLPVGMLAPDFSLPDQNGKIVSLSALRGHNAVLVFYPGDDTTVCRQQLCEFRDRWAAAQSGKRYHLAILIGKREIGRKRTHGQWIGEEPVEQTPLL